MRNRPRSEIRVGISGWTYRPWRGTFYPKGLPLKNELAYASAVLPSIEINGTFYRLQRPRSFATWYEQTPAEFIFSVKAPRFITHTKRLRDVQTPLANFMVSGLLRLNEKLGPILWQFPPNMRYDEKVFERFLGLLPQTTNEAARMVRKSDQRVKGRTWAEVDEDRPLRHAVEIRNRSFATAAFVRMLRNFHAALVVADTAGKWPMLHDVTADFVYVRLHGAEELYASGYTDEALEDWARKIQAWSRGPDAADGRRVDGKAARRPRRDVYVYFDNDVKVKAPFDAARLAVKLGLRGHPLDWGAGKKGEVPERQWRPV